MLALFIRFLSILFCSDYIYHKLLGLEQVGNSSKRQLTDFILYDLILSLILSLIAPSLQHLSYIIIPLFHFVYIGIKSKMYSGTIFFTLILSYGLCYCIFFISNFFVAILLGLIGWFLLNKVQYQDIFIQLVTCTLTFILCPLPFRISRLKKGMPFLRQNNISTFGLQIGLTVLFCSILISYQNLNNEGYNQWTFLLFFFILILFLSLFIWWREQLRQTYLDKLRKRDMEQLEAELQDCQLTISSLEEENKQQAHLIHRDNKQIAALELAVESYLTTTYTNTDAQKEYGQKLLNELQKENLERTQMISNMTTTNHLSPTNILSVDNMLNLMLQKCHSHHIILEFSLHGTIEYFLDQIIIEKDFLTLLADLLENALIATIHGKGSAILLHIGTMDENYFISVWDSGIPFTKEVLFHLGKKPYTTHKEDGGSGIGLVSTYELLQKYQASLHIDECVNSKNDYTKQVSIIFDQKKEYHLKTNRDADELSYLQQRSDLQICKN